MWLIFMIEAEKHIKNVELSINSSNSESDEN